jgi:hypothetical protein
MDWIVKITEIVCGIFLYKATVRAKRGQSSATTKTIVFADGISQARALLAAMYGDENVVSVNRITEGQISEAVPYTAKPVVQRVPRVLPTDYTHSLAQKALLNQMKRNALHVKPTIDDLRAAQSDFEAEQKRVNREYEDALNDRAKWAGIRKRRLSKA